MAAIDDTSPRIPGFTITGFLGRGACGTVYAAIQNQLARKVALKVLTPEALSSKHLRRRFQREAQALAAVRHPGLVEVLAFQGDGPVPYLAMEMLGGGTLRERLDRAPKGLGAEASLRLARELLEALDALHAAGMIHRDLKPSNVLFRSDGQAVLSDLGVVHVNLEGATRMTGTGELLGTLPYFAPELYRDREPTVRSDLFALGVTLYEAITGQHPTEFQPFPKDFVGTDPRVLAKTCPAGLASLVVRMIHANPAVRPASAAAALEKLEGTAADRSHRIKPRAILGRPAFPAAGIALAVGLSVGLFAGIWLGARGQVTKVPAPVASASGPATLLGLASWPQPALALEVAVPMRASWLDTGGFATEVRDVPLLPGRATVPVPAALVPARRGVLRIAPLEGRATDLIVDLAPLAPPLPDPQLGIAIPVGAAEPVVRGPAGPLRLPDLVRLTGAGRVVCSAPKPTPALEAALTELARLPDVKPIVQIPDDAARVAEPPGKSPWGPLLKRVSEAGVPQVMVLPALPTQDPFANTPPVRASVTAELDAAWRRDLRAIHPDLVLLPPPIALTLAALGVDVATPADRPLSVVAPLIHDSSRQWDAMVAHLVRLLQRPDAASRTAFVWLSQSEAAKDAWGALSTGRPESKGMLEELSIARSLVLARRAFPHSTLIAELAYSSDSLTPDFDVVVRTANALRGLTCLGPVATGGDRGPRVTPARDLVALSFGGARKVQVIFPDAGRCTGRFTPGAPGMLCVGSQGAGSRNVQRIHLDTSPVDLDIEGGLAVYEELAPAARLER